MNPKKFLSIGQMASITGLTVKALRFYEKEGLLEPAHTDPFSRYRYYTAEQFFLCDIIKGARQIGFGIDAIRPVIAARDKEAVTAFLEEGTRTLETRIREMEARLESVRRLRSALADAEAAVRQKGITIRDLPERKLLTTGIAGITEPDEITERYYRLLVRLESKGYANGFESGVLLETDGEGRSVPSRLYVAAIVPAGGDEGGLFTVPGGRIACCTVPVASPTSQAGKINRWLIREGINPPLILQTDLLTDPFRPTEYVEIQVPLEGD